MILDFDKDCLDIKFQNSFNIILGEFLVALDDDFGTFHRNDLTGVLVNKVLRPGVNDSGGKLFSDDFFQIGLGDLHLFSKREDVQNIFVRLKTDSSQQRSNRELFLSVDVSIHDIVDVGGKLHPRPFERDNTGGIELGAVRVELRSEENTR